MSVTSVTVNILIWIIAIALVCLAMRWYVKKRYKKLDKKVEKMAEEDKERIDRLRNEQDTSNKHRQEVLNGRRTKQRDSTSPTSPTSSGSSSGSTEASTSTSSEGDTSATGTEELDSRGTGRDENSIPENSPEGADERRSDLQDRDTIRDDSDQRDSEEDWADFS